MTIVEAVLLGIIQGLTEFLPVSSSGHLELGSFLLNTTSGDNLLFAIVVHSATACSTVIVFWRDIRSILAGIFQFEWNDSTRFLFYIFISMIPVGIVGVLFEDRIKSLFSGNVPMVASMLILTGIFLLITNFIGETDRPVDGKRAFIIGIAQAFAILPGISRSGATISTALVLGVEKGQAARFSFLMVLIPILGAMLLKVKDLLSQTEVTSSLGGGQVIGGFMAAFLSGLIACRWMIKLVRQGRLIYFAIYCFAVGSCVLFLYYF